MPLRISWSMSVSLRRRQGEGRHLWSRRIAIRCPLLLAGIAQRPLRVGCETNADVERDLMCDACPGRLQRCARPWRRGVAFASWDLCSAAASLRWCPTCCTVGELLPFLERRRNARCQRPCHRPVEPMLASVRRLMVTSDCIGLACFGLLRRGSVRLQEIR